MNFISTPIPPAVGQPIAGKTPTGEPVITGPVLRLTPWVSLAALGFATSLATTASRRYVVAYPTKEVPVSHFPVQAPLKAETAVAAAVSIVPTGGFTICTHYSTDVRNCNSDLAIRGK